MPTDEFTDEEATEYKLHNTTSARTWAREFCDRFRVAEETGEWVDDAEGLMIAWFANAIETGRDHGSRQPKSDDDRAAIWERAWKAGYESRVAEENPDPAPEVSP